MGLSAWSRFKQWVKHRLFSAFWPVVRSRLFRKLRALVSKALPPLCICAAAAGLGAAAASPLGFPLGYGALAGVAAAVGTFGIRRLCQHLVPPRHSSRFVAVFQSQRETPSGRFLITETRVSRR